MKGCRPLSDTELASVTEELSGHRDSLRDVCLFVVGHRTGFRISELLSIRLGDVCRHGHVLEELGVRRKSMKGKKAARSVPIHAQARVAIEAWVKELRRRGIVDPHVPLFMSNRRKAMNRRTAWNLLKRAYRACGFSGKTGTHSMRKTFARRMHDALGRDIMKTQKALGHARITSTVSYLSFDESEIDDAILKS